MLLLSLLLSLEPPSSPDEGPTTTLVDEQLSPVLALPPDTLRALQRRRYAVAIKGLEAMDRTKLAGDQVGDHAFLIAWSKLRLGRGAEAVSLIELVDKAEHVPQAYNQLTLGELLVHDGRAVDALPVLESVPEQSLLWPRAQMVLARAYKDLGRTLDTRLVYERLASREDPADGTALALSALATLAGPQSDEAYHHERRLWAAYPYTPQGRRATANLNAYGPFPTWREVAIRADTAMRSWKYAEAISLGTKYGSQIDADDADACMLRFAHGRSLFKQGNVTGASTILRSNGETCAGVDEDRGAKSLYLAGKSLERKKLWGKAATVYERIADLYPDHSIADDGLALAGIGYQESGQPAKARETWERQVRTYPTGDLAGEGAWRLAWTSWNAGDTEEAIAWADYAAEHVPVDVSPEHVRAAMYWRARWRVVPDPSDPTALDPTSLPQALDAWEALCRDHPYSYYALLAAARLYEHAPERVPARPELSSSEGWEVRQVFVDDHASGAGVQLAALGLYREALMEFEAAGYENMTPPERALVTEQRWEAGEWLLAHDELRRWLRTHPPEALGPQRDDVLRVAYPETYWPEVQTATKPYSWDPRIFHALVREESNFNKDIRSHADAWGLAQLLPSTAREVAGWMGTTVSTSQLTDPATNLKLGARYFESLMHTNGQNPQLAMACYNAGCGNVKKWRARFGDLPTDQFVESIPFRETRHYAKRVSRTWQIYHLLYDNGPAFPDLSAFNQSAFTR